MFKFFLIGCFSMLLSYSSFADENRVVAKVDGKPVYESQVREKVAKFLEFNGMSENSKFSYETLNDDMKKEIIKNVILSDLVLKEAQESKIDQDKEFKESAQFTLDQLMQRFFLEKVIKESVTEEMIQAEYKKYVEEQSKIKEFKVAQILVKNEEEAKEVKKKLDKGADFAVLVKEFSTDSNKENGGELDYFVEGQMVMPFEEATKKMKIGEISDPVKTDFGYHIIKLIDVRPVRVLPLDDMREKIEEELSAKFIKNYILKLEQKNRVEFF